MKPEYRLEPCSSALSRVTGMPFAWSLNPYTGCTHQCTFCYVRAFERRAERPSGDAYGQSIRVKTNVVEVLSREVRRRGWKRPEVAVGTGTDPYQPAEGRFRLTRGCIEVLADAKNPFSVITRGPLIIRDVDVLSAAARRGGVTVSVSVPTLDRDVWRTTEPGTAPPLQRLRAMAALAKAGITVNVSISPIIPGLSDDPAGIDAVLRAAKDAGAQGVWCRVLELRPGTREHFLERLRRDWPGVAPSYVALYGARGYIADREREAREATVQQLRQRWEFPVRSWRKEAPDQERQLALL